MTEYTPQERSLLDELAKIALPHLLPVMISSPSAVTCRRVTAATGDAAYDIARHMLSRRAAILKEGKPSE